VHDEKDSPVVGPAAGLPEQAVRALRADGRLAEAADLVDQLGPYGVGDRIDAKRRAGRSGGSAGVRQAGP
jgi:hypothetical protein